MNLAEYFAAIKGTGILATSDADGNASMIGPESNWAKKRHALPQLFPVDC